MLRRPIDLRSDTVTRPTAAMRRAMAEADVGDDVYGEDPTVNALEARTAELLGKEAALFVPSGTMANQIAIGLHAGPGDELICDATAHVYRWEGGGIARLWGVTTRTIGARRRPLRDRRADRRGPARRPALCPDCAWSAWRTRTTGGEGVSSRSPTSRRSPPGRASEGWPCTSTAPG